MELVENIKKIGGKEINKMINAKSAALNWVCQKEHVPAILHYDIEFRLELCKIIKKFIKNENKFLKANSLISKLSDELVQKFSKEEDIAGAWNNQQRIFKLLPSTPTKIQKKMGVSLGTVAYHLNDLEKLGIVIKTKDKSKRGQPTTYKIKKWMKKIRKR
jgi:hypothetical protein